MIPKPRKMNPLVYLFPERVQRGQGSRQTKETQLMNLKLLVQVSPSQLVTTKHCKLHALATPPKYIPRNAFQEDNPLLNPIQSSPMFAGNGHQEATELASALNTCVLITLVRKELHACRFQGSGNQTPNKFPLALIHIIQLLSASRSSPNVLGPSGPLSSMNDGFRLNKRPSIYHRGAPAATTEAALSPFESRQSDGAALDLPPLWSWEGYQECRELWGS